MPTQPALKRSSALLATAALTFTGLTLAAAPVALAVDSPSSSVAASTTATHVTDNATLSWSIKDSFIKYVTGAFAGGTITVTGGPTFNGSSFAWEGATGEFTGANGTINYPGTIHITAHKGALDITYTNIKLVINGTSGTLVMDVKSKGYNGSPDIDSTAVNFATVDLSGITFKAGTISANQAPTTLTADGAAAFAGFYKPGDVLAPMTFSATLTEKPAPTPEPTPEPTPAPSTPATDGVSNAAGTVTWGIKDSFLNYLISQNAVTPGENTTLEGNNFVFAAATAQKTDTGYSISVPGSFSLVAHGGVLNINLHSFRVVTDGAQGYIYATGTSANTGEITDQPIASFDASALTTDSAGNLLLEGVPTVATAHAASIFGARYAEGTAFDPLYLRVASPVVEDAPAPAPSETPAPAPSETPAPSPSAEPTATPSAQPSAEPSVAPSAQPTAEPTTQPSAQPTVVPSAQPSTDPAKAPQCVPVTVTETIAGATTTQADGTVSAATFDWGVRSSFRNYIGGGIAKGSWELNGVTYANQAFGWSNGTGTYANGKGSVAFEGSVRFTGHGGTLNTLMANPRLEINGSTGTLYLTVSSNDVQGQTTHHGEVAFANVDLAGLTVNGSTISVSGASATLTAEGAAAFAGFYSAGMALDPISFTGTLGSQTVTGASQTIEKTQYVAENGANCDELNAQAQRQSAAQKSAAQQASSGSSAGAQRLASTGASVGALALAGAALVAGGVAVARRRR